MAKRYGSVIDMLCDLLHEAYQENAKLEDEATAFRNMPGRAPCGWSGPTCPDCGQPAVIERVSCIACSKVFEAGSLGSFKRVK